jgi:hypothetical protein
MPMRNNVLIVPRPTSTQESPPFAASTAISMMAPIATAQHTQVPTANARSVVFFAIFSI